MTQRFHIVGYRSDDAGHRTGVLMMVDDEIPGWIDWSATKAHRPFPEHYVNGQPKPMSEYFIDPEMQAILSQTKSRREKRRLS